MEDSAQTPGLGASVAPAPPEPCIAGSEELRRLALEEAAQTLPQEMAAMLPAAGLAEVAEICSLSPDAAVEDLAIALASLLVDVLWQPLAGCVSSLLSCSVDELRVKLQLFWRCAVALCLMPLPQLSALSLRKRSFLRDLDAHLPAPEATPAAARLAHLRLNLPIFAMVARLPTDAAPGPQGAAAAPSGGPSGGPAPKPAQEAPELGASAAAARAARSSAGPSKDTGAPERLDKQLTAARHTYDVGYARWERFDINAALREADEEEARAQRTEAVRLLDAPPPPCDDPKEAIDQALARLRGGGPELDGPPAGPTPQGAGETAERSEQAAAFLLTSATPAMPVADTLGTEATKVDAVAEVAALQVGGSSVADAGTARGEAAHSLVLPETGPADSTGRALSRDYERWDQFQGDVDELEELEDEDGAELDPTTYNLDALTGPKEEVALIRAHWRREGRQQTRDGRSRATTTAARPSPLPTLPTGPVVPRPCEYRPADDPQAAAARAIDRAYAKWNNFDADALLLELDNEGTTQEGKAMRCMTGQGSTVLTTEQYTKDREEYELDQEIEQHAATLKKAVAQRFKDASGFKAEGNDLLRAGKAEAACQAYQRGLEAMSLCQQAAVLMADSMSDRQERLVADLHRNMAAAQLQAGDLQGAVESCTAALERAVADDDGKARYRRATALLRLGRAEEASRDIERLATTRGEADAAVCRLREEAAAAAGAVPGSRAGGEAAGGAPTHSPMSLSGMD